MAGVNKMATISENADIAVLQNQMKTALTGIESINTKLDNQVGLYVTQGEFKEFKNRWALSHLLVSIISVIFAALVTAYFTTKH